MNTRFINFIIGGCYLGEKAQPFHDKAKKILFQMYDHLLLERRRLVKRREEDE